MPPLPTSSTIDEVLAADEHLVARALAGHRDAFNRLVVRYEARLFRFLSRTSPNAADVEDAMQRAFVKAYRHLATFDPRHPFTTWLFTIAVRELRSLQRRPALRIEPLHDDHDPAAPPTPDHAPGDLWAAAHRVLTNTQYTALWLRYGEDLPVRDVARVMSRPRVWVSVTLHRACAALRAAVRPDDDRGPTPNARPTRRSNPTPQPARGAS